MLYIPPRWLPGGHLQTIYPSTFVRKPAVAYRRERWEAPDGDFIDIDFVELGHEIEDGIQLALQMRNVFFGDGNARKTRDTLHRGGIDRHETLDCARNHGTARSITRSFAGATDLVPHDVVKRGNESRSFDAICAKSFA